LPKNTTFAEGLAFGELCAPFLNGFDVNHTRELREAVEGRGAYCVALPGEEPEVSADGPADCSDRVMLGLLKLMKRRQELYQLDLPRFDAMQREAAEEVRKQDAAIAESREPEGTDQDERPRAVVQRLQNGLKRFLACASERRVPELRYESKLATTALSNVCMAVSYRELAPAFREAAAS
jgi:hypothetical protein